MKVIIQDALSEKFLANGRWVDHFSDAEDFRIVARAYEIGLRNVDGNFHVLFYFTDADISVVVISGHGKGEPVAA